MSKNCPHCQEPLHVDPVMFTSDDDEVLEICHRCEGEVVMRRRAVGYEYTLEKA
jgi:NAD-dependent SIR2 family protein deacetylase